MATGPQLGDVIVRNTFNGGFDIVEADGHFVAGPFDTFGAALEFAKIEAEDAAVWQQVVDSRGRPLGPPGRVTPVA